MAWWAILCPPLFTLAVWRAAWWQWRLPAEDGALENLEGLVAFGLSSGIVLGVVASRSARDWRLVRRSGAGLVALGVCELLLTALLDGRAHLVYTLLLIGPWIFAALGYYPAHRFTGAAPWGTALATALVPLLVASFFALPIADQL